jgi:hypothetical protein
MSPYYHKDYKTNILPILLDFVKQKTGFQKTIFCYADGR